MDQEEKAQFYTADCSLATQAYLLPLNWWQQWQYYTEEDGPRPPRIDNAALEEHLAQGLALSACKAVSRSQWRLLRKWYGGGPELEVCLSNDSEEAELIQVRACTYEDYTGSRSPWELVSMSAEVDWATLHLHLCGRFKVNKAIIHLVQLDTFGRSALQPLSSDEPVPLVRGCELVVEADEETDDEELISPVGRNSSTGNP